LQTNPFLMSCNPLPLTGSEEVDRLRGGTTPRVPADADALPDRQSLGVRTDGGDPADHLVAEDRGVLRDALELPRGADVRAC
jgi:hypothetical protein